jgi:superfamily I DNA and RNA helicase
MSWFIPYNQLDNEQMIFLQNVNNNQSSNFWLKGYAGSGKSVLLIHCLLKAKEQNPKTRIVIVLFTHALIDMIKTGIPEQYSDTVVVTYHEFYKMKGSWDLILVDEVQDLPEYIVRNIQSKGKRVIVAGDVNQSIYDNVCEVQKINDILNGSSFSLGIIHRISRRIRQIAQFFCSDRNGFNSASLGRLVELPPRLVKADSYEEECKWLILTVKEYAQNNYAPAILIPKHIKIFNFFQTLLKTENKQLLPDKYNDGGLNSYIAINAHLNSNGLKFQYLGNGIGSFENSTKDKLVTVMTYHSAKGLDFKAVFVPFLNNKLQIWGDAERAKTLFFVALTRSREQLFLSYHGTKHPYLAMIPENETHKLNAFDEIKRMENPLGDTQDEAPAFIF